MPLQVINGVGQARIRGNSSGGAAASFDADAQTFITNASISNSTQQNALNDLVLDLKAANIWTKMKALYPMIGGTAASHLVNLKTPGTYNLTFAGGWTHSASGATPNGSTGYADTGINLQTDFTLYSAHYSMYFRPAAGTYSFMGVTCCSPYTQEGWMLANNGVNYGGFYNQDEGGVKVTDNSPGGHYVSSIISSSLTFMTKKNTILGTNVASQVPANTTIYLGAVHQASPNQPVLYGNGQMSFASIGSGLTIMESLVFNQIVEKYQKALSRNVDTDKSFYFNRNYTNETNAFIFNGEISDVTQQAAINTLVTDLKAAGIFTKMKALYPMIGGTANSHKFNLKDPRDLDDAYRLQFNGGWTHSSSGATPNGTDGYANTFLKPNTVLTNNSTHMFYYSRTQTNPSLATFDMGTSNGTSATIFSISIQLSNNLYADSYNSTSNRITVANTTSLGGFMNNRTSSTSFKTFKNGTQLGTTLTTASSGFSSLGGNVYIGCLNYSNSSSPSFYSNRQCAFSSIGDGLTDAEATTFYNAVQAFQTSLGRQV